jgi:hypothetical protein
VVEPIPLSSLCKPLLLGAMDLENRGKEEPAQLPTLRVAPGLAGSVAIRACSDSGRITDNPEIIG